MEHSKFGEEGKYAKAHEAALAARDGVEAVEPEVEVNEAGNEPEAEDPVLETPAEGTEGETTEPVATETEPAPEEQPA